MTTGEDEPQRHVVVFDCNVYLDVARLIGPPFTWDRFDAAVAQVMPAPVPHPGDGAYDSLRALAVYTSGRFAGNETLEVWTNAHIDKIVRGKAEQGTEPNASGYYGLGWSRPDAQTLIDDLIGDLESRSNGGTLGAHYPEGNPPLDYEDGMVYGACRSLMGEDPLANIYCVTRDRGFLDAHRRNELSGCAVVMTPARFLALIRAARAQYSIRRMNPATNP